MVQINFQDAIILTLFVYVVPILFLYGCVGLMYLIRNKYYTSYYEKKYIQNFKESYNKFIENNVSEIVTYYLIGSVPVVPYKFNKKCIFWMFRNDKYVRKIFEEVIHKLADDEYKFINTRFYDCKTDVVLKLREK